MENAIVRDIIIGEDKISLKDIIIIAQGHSRVKISSDIKFTEKINNSRKNLISLMERDVPIYGVTTGYGKSCGNRLKMDFAEKNGINLTRFHGCGTGEPIGIEETRAAMICRIISLAKGYSGVTGELLEQLAAFINNGITPVVPSEGSVGASGDLTPMSYVAASLAGERDVYYKGRRVPARDALKESGLAPYELKAKESLAIMNGTTTMTGIAVMVIHRAKNILDAAVKAAALTSHSLMGNRHHFHPTISRIKPHPGQIAVSGTINSLLESPDDVNDSELEASESSTLQDPYSLRCSPQILGVVYDTLQWVEEWVETEANSVNDNPLVDPDTGELLMGGNFYGGHIAASMDSLKAVLASVADMSDRQVMLMVDPHVNRGLPADLVSVDDEERFFNHGFKAMSISSSALTAEALKLTMPAAVFSRSTESHNQDKVSLGTIAARDALRITELVSRVVSIHLMAAAQACELRGNMEKREKIESLVNCIRSYAEKTVEDRPMDRDIEKISEKILGTGICGEYGI